MFFPGCQLAASDPGHLERVYAHLRERYSPATGLLLYCCGAPADWAGQAGVFDETLAGLRERLGEPRLAARDPRLPDLRDRLRARACPRCETVSLWEVLARGRAARRRSRLGRREAGRRARRLHGALSDVRPARRPRPARDLRLRGRRARAVARAHRVLRVRRPDAVREPGAGRRRRAPARRTRATPTSSPTAPCAATASRPRASRRCTSSTCCSATTSPPAPRGAGPVLTQRAGQRAALKQRLLADVWGGGRAGARLARRRCCVSPEVEDLLEQRFIRPEEVLQVVARGEETGRRFVEPSTGRRLASLAAGRRDVLGRVRAGGRALPRPHGVQSPHGVQAAAVASRRLDASTRTAGSGGAPSATILSSRAPSRSPTWSPASP